LRLRALPGRFLTVEQIPLRRETPAEGATRAELNSVLRVERWPVPGETQPRASMPDRWDQQ